MEILSSDAFNIFTGVIFWRSSKKQARKPNCKWMSLYLFDWLNILWHFPISFDNDDDFFSLLFLCCLFTSVSLILKIPAFVLFLRNFFARGWGVFKKFPTRREFFAYLKIISVPLNMTTNDMKWNKLGSETISVQIHSKVILEGCGNKFPVFTIPKTWTRTIIKKLEIVQELLEIRCSLISEIDN